MNRDSYTMRPAIATPCRERSTRCRFPRDPGAARVSRRGSMPSPPAIPRRRAVF